MSSILQVTTVFSKLADENVKHRAFKVEGSRHNCFKNEDTSEAKPVETEEENKVEEKDDAGETPTPATVAMIVNL